MPISHKFQNHDFQNGFQTHDSILDVTPYLPEVIIIGTFNHGWDWNRADFFYGRGMYMWTILGNLFLHNRNELVNRRTLTNDNPTLRQIFEICSKGKIVFADIVKGTRQNINAVPSINEQQILVNNEYVWSGYKDGPLDLMGSNEWLDDNVDSILNFINQTPSIKHVYFSFKSGTWMVNKLNTICHELRGDVSSGSIFTPTGNGFGANLPAPYNNRAWSLAHCWVWNGLDNTLEINRAGYTHLDHDWLQRCGVHPNNF